MDRLIVNCDLGENESAAQTASLIASVDAVNISCGVHAGSLAKTREALLLAKQQGVMVGAHPGLAAEGGRGTRAPTALEFRALLRAQLDSFMSLAAEICIDVTYVKLHGSLYSAVEADSILLDVYLSELREMDLGLGVYALAGGRCVAAARSANFRVWAEAFADRGYLEGGSLVPRGSPGALLGLTDAERRFIQWQVSGDMPTVDGSSFALRADTICVHSDSPEAGQLISAVKAAIQSTAL